MNILTAFLFFLIIFIAAAGPVQLLPGAAGIATAVAAGILQQQDQQLALSGSLGAARILQALPGRKFLQTSTSAEEKLLASLAVGNISVANETLLEGADPNFQNEDGLSPMIIAIRSDNKLMVQLLVQFGADIYDFVLNQDTGDKTDGLTFAANLGSIEAMAALLEAGAALDKLNARGFSALHYAVSRGQIEAATLLLDERAGVDIPSAKLITPLFTAVSIQNLELVRLLISRGADVERWNGKIGWTPVIAGVNVNSVEVLQELILAGADVNRSDKRFRTPLWFAAYLGQIDPMKVLIQNGADLSVQIYGKSLRDYLCGCTTNPEVAIACNFIECQDPENLEALLE